MGIYEIDYEKEISPLLHLQFGKSALILRQCFDPTRGGLQMTRYTGKPISSVEEAENTIMGLGLKYTDSLPELPFAIRRQCAYVAQGCRRGFGNNVLMHPNLAAQINEELGTDRTEIRVGRWFSKGKLRKFSNEGDIRIWCSDHMPEYTFIAYYKGKNKFDSAAILIEDTDLTLSMVIPPDTYRCIKTESYIRYTEVINKDSQDISVELIISGI